MSDANYRVELIERELVGVQLVEKELIDVTLEVVDIIYKEGTVEGIFIFNEVPHKITALKFSTQYNFVSGTIQVFLNGIKEKNIVENASNAFTLPIETIISDTVEVNYKKL